MFFLSGLAKPTLHFFDSYNALEGNEWQIAQLEIPLDCVKPDEECLNKSLKRFVFVRKDDSGSIWNRSIGFISTFMSSFFEYKVETMQGVFCIKKNSLYRYEDIQLQLEEKISRIFFDAIPEVCLHSLYSVDDNTSELSYIRREKKLLNSLKNNDVKSLEDVLASYMHEDDWISYFHEILFLAKTTNSVSCLKDAINPLLKEIEGNLEIALKKSHLSGFVVDRNQFSQNSLSGPFLDAQLRMLARIHSFFSGIGLPLFIEGFIKKNCNNGAIPLLANPWNPEEDLVQGAQLDGDISSALIKIREIEASLFSRTHEINQMVIDQGSAQIEVEHLHGGSHEISVCTIDAEKVNLMLKKK